MKRRIFSIILALSLCLSLFPVQALAEEPDPFLCRHHPEHTEDCGFTEASEEKPGTPCGYDCPICSIEELTAALPGEVTEANAEEVRAQLEEILDLFAGLTEEEQEQMDLSRCEALREALDLLQGDLPGTEISLADDAVQEEVQYRVDGGEWKSSSLFDAIWAGYAATKTMEINLNRDILLLTNSNWTYTSPLSNCPSWIIDGNGHTIKRGDTGVAQIFTIQSTTLTLKNITIDGGAVWDGDDPATRKNTGLTLTGNKYLIDTSLEGPGKLILDDGAILQNNNLTSYYAGAVAVFNNGEVTMKAGSKILNNAAVNGGGVCVISGSFTMEGGEISGNSALNLTSSSGGGIFVDSAGTCTMSGGEVKNNYASNNGGGVGIGGTFTMTGGSVVENKSTAGGGGVSILGGNAYITGGQIERNSISGTMGGGVLMYSGTLTAGGSLTVSENTKAAGAANNIYLRPGTTITVDTVYPLTSGARMGVTPASAPTDVTPTVITSGAADVQYFFSDNPLYTVGNHTDGAVQLTRNPPCTVQFDANGGTLDDESKEATTNSTTGKLDSLPEPSRTGYAFDGWFTALEGGTEVTKDTVLATSTSSTSITLYARWSLITVTGVTLNKEHLTLPVGGSEQLTADVEPDNAADRTVTWSSSDETVATVNSSGVVSALKGGSADITVTTTDGGKTAVCHVTITVPVTGVTLDETSLSLTVGETAQLTATVSPSDATDQTTTWQSSDENVATVDSSGTVTAIGAGNATITAATSDGGKTATCAVKVIAPLTDAVVQVTGDYTYTGSAIVPAADAVTVTLNGQAIDPGQYTFSVSSNISAGDAVVTVTALESGSYSGSAGGTFVIKKAPLTVRAKDQSITYGQRIDLRPEQVTCTGLCGRDRLTAVTLTPETENVPGGSLTPSAPQIQNSSGGDASGNYDLTLQTGNLTITRAPLTITAADITERTYQPGSREASVSGVTFEGLVNDETLTLGTDYTAAGTFESPDAGTEKPVTVRVTLTGSKASNYSLANSEFAAKGTVTRASQEALHITGLPTGTVTYGDTFTLSAGTGVTWSASGAAVDSQGHVTVTGVGEATVTALKPGGQNYENVQAEVTFTAVKKALTVTGAAARDRAYDGTNTVELTGVTLSGVVEGDEVSVDTAHLTGALSGSDAGTYASVTLPALTLTGGKAACYTLTQPAAVPANVTVQKAPALDTKPGDLAVANDRAHSYIYGLGALRPDVPEGMSLGSAPVTYTLDSVSLGSYYRGGAGIEGQTLTLPIEAVDSTEVREIGTVTVTIHAGNFQDMTAVLHVRSVNKTVPTGEPVLSASVLTYGQPLSTITLSGSMKDGSTDVPGVFTWTSPNNRPAVQDRYAAAWTFTPADRDRYALVTGTAILTVQKAVPSLTLTASPVSLSHGGTVTLTLSGLPEGGSATVVCSDPGIPVAKGSGGTWTAVLPAGGASYTFTASYAGDENHSSAEASCTVSVDQAVTQLRLTPSPASLTGGGTVTLTLSGLPEGGTASVTCSDSGVTVTKGEGNTWTAVLPNRSQTYTFTASYAGDAGHSPASDSCEVSVREEILLPNPPAGDEDQQFKLVMETGISEVPAGLKDLETLNTPEKLENAMRTEITRTGVPSANTAVFNVALLVSTDGGLTWAPATKDNFPQGGLTVTLPYPAGTDSSFRFTVVHMFTTSDFGKQPGTTEVFTAEQVKHTALGLQVVVTGLSPISVGWTKEDPNPPEPPTPSNPSGSHSGGGDPDVYNVTVENAAHGKVSSNRAKASRGSTVTLTVTPDSGYVLDSLTAVSRGETLSLTEREDGRYAFTMPGRSVTVTASFVPLPEDERKTCGGGPDCPSYGFTDLGGTDAWYHQAVDYVLENGLMNGYSSSTFGPNNTLTRAQFAQILFNRADRPAVNYLMQFSDVPQDAWCTEAIRWAASEGIVGGYGDGTFGPNRNITREQLAVMLWRYAGSPAAAGGELRFADADKAGAYALEALRWASENGVVNGKSGNLLDPKGLATRAQTAQMLMNFLKTA